MFVVLGGGRRIRPWTVAVSTLICIHPMLLAQLDDMQALLIPNVSRAVKTEFGLEVGFPRVERGEPGFLADGVHSF